jgi:type I restriction enzyme, S subunit
MVGVVPEEFGEAYINQHIALIRPKTDEVEPHWLANYLAGHRMQKWLSNINESGAKAGLNLPQVRSLPVTRPPRPEQEMIAEMFTLMDKQLAETESNANKLKSLKRGLMQDLLTGRVSVDPLLNLHSEPVIS